MNSDRSGKWLADSMGGRFARMAAMSPPNRTCAASMSWRRSAIARSAWRWGMRCRRSSRYCAPRMMRPSRWNRRLTSMAAIISHMVKGRLPSLGRGWDWRGYISAAGVVAASTAVGWPLHHKLGLANVNILMLYLLGVLWIATRHSRGAAILASVLGG